MFWGACQECLFWMLLLFPSVEGDFFWRPKKFQRIQCFILDLLVWFWNEW